MGLYQDITQDLTEASRGELSDAFRILQFITLTNVYDDVNMINVPTPISTDVYCSVQSEFEGEIIDVAALTNNVRIIVIDTDRNGVNFEVDMVIIDGSNKYTLKGFNTDPVQASWTIFARRLG